MKSRVLKATVGLLALVGVGAIAMACGGGGGEEAKTDNQPAQQAAAQVTTKLFLDVDMVRGPENMSAEEKTRKSCVQANTYPLGGQVVWRVRVVDPKTGDAMDANALESVTVTLADGQAFTAKYGPHPKDPPNESFWTTSWKVPATYPTGTVDFKIVAKDKEGRTGEWKQISAVKAAVLTIVASDPLASADFPDDALAAAQ